VTYGTVQHEDATYQITFTYDDGDNVYQFSTQFASGDIPDQDTWFQGLVNSLDSVPSFTVQSAVKKTNASQHVTVD
jgi:hypothetical protein